jgi:hypothetical protein
MAELHSVPPVSPPIYAISDALEDASPEKAAVWRLGKLIIDHNHEVRKEKCGHEDWADATYPRVAYLPIDAIGPDDSYI